MAIPQDIVQPLKDTLDKAQDVMVLLPQNAGQEMVAAALGLYHVLNEGGKNVIVACPTKLSDSSHALPGGDQVTAKIGNRNLVISLKVAERDSIDKVSYNLDEDAKVFNLIIQPKKGHTPLKREDVSFTYSGAQADMIVIVGANRLEDLGALYENERKLFTEAKTVSLHRFATAAFADYQVVDSQASGYSELAYELGKEMGLNPTADAATAFLAGIDLATNNLQSGNLRPDTLENMAQLLRAGGTRRGFAPSSKPAAPVEPAAEVKAEVVKAEDKKVPDEWLSPKIYKSSKNQ